MRYFVVAALFAMLLTPINSGACTAMYLETTSSDLVQEIRDSSDILFVGMVEKIEDVRSSDGERLTQTSTFLVTESWKGEKANRVITKVTHQCCMCSFPFVEGESYLVVANERADGLYSVMFSSLTRVASEAAEIVSILNELRDDDKAT